MALQLKISQETRQKRLDTLLYYLEDMNSGKNYFPPTSSFIDSLKSYGSYTPKQGIAVSNIANNCATNNGCWNIYELLKGFININSSFAKHSIERMNLDDYMTLVYILTDGQLLIADNWRKELNLPIRYDHYLEK